MMGKNFIPFAAREVVILAAGETRAAKVTSLAISSKKPEDHTVWQDLCVWEPGKTNAYNDATTTGFDNDLFMRIGMKSRGYLLDRPAPVGVLCNANRPMHAVWQFERPYKLFPGQELKARIIAGGIPEAADPSVVSEERTRKGMPGITFNCVREKDGIPITLHASLQELLDTGDERALVGPHMKCPSDSPIRIYGVSHFQYYNYDADPTNTEPLGIEVYGANGQTWIHRVIDPATTLSAQEIIGAWIDPPTSLIELGVNRGWRTPNGTPLVIEFENRSASSKEFVVTARGFAEVDHE